VRNLELLRLVQAVVKHVHALEVVVAELGHRLRQLPTLSDVSLVSMQVASVAYAARCHLRIRKSPPFAFVFFGGLLSSV
jgi:hypothetical protein